MTAAEQLELDNKKMEEQLRQVRELKQMQ